MLKTAVWQLCRRCERPFAVSQCAHTMRFANIIWPVRQPGQRRRRSPPGENRVLWRAGADMCPSRRAGGAQKIDSAAIEMMRSPIPVFDLGGVLLPFDSPVPCSRNSAFGVRERRAAIHSLRVAEKRSLAWQRNSRPPSTAIGQPCCGSHHRKTNVGVVGAVRRSSEHRTTR